MADMTPLVLEIKANTSSATASIRKLKSEMSGLGKSFGTSGMKSFSTSMSKASKSSNTFFKTLATAPFKKLSKDITGTVGAVSKLGAAFKRVLFYRAIRSMIREIGDAFKRGINNLYAWSQGIGGEFAASMDRISTAFNYFKNSVGAAVAPLINALAPAIDFVIDKAVALLNVINQLFAKLTGATYWTKAVKGATAYGDAIGGAGAAAKEALRYLAPFDELNRLPADSGSGGGGGGGASGGGGLFEIQEDFSEAVSNFAEMVKEAWNTGDWEEVGTFLGNKVNDLINNLPWATMGANVGKFINALFGTEYWTLETINFVNLGKKIAEFVNNALENIDFDIAGRLQVRKLTAILDTIIGFIEGLDWGLVASSISDFIVGALSEFSDWLDGTDWDTFTIKLHNGIINAINGVKKEDISNAIANLLKSFAGAVIEITVTFARSTWIDLKNEWNLRMLEFKNDAVQVVVSFALDATIWPLKIHDWVSEYIRNPILEEVADAFGVDTSSAGYVLGESLVNNFGLAIAKTFPGIGSVVNIAELVGSLFGGGTWEEIKQKFKDEWNGFWDDIAAWLNGGDAPDWTRSLASIIAEKLNLGEVFTDAWKDLKESLVEGWQNFINDPTISKILDFFSNPIGTLMDLVEGLGSGSSTSETDTGTIGVGVGTGIGANTFNIPVTAEISDFKFADKFRMPDVDSKADITESSFADKFRRPDVDSNANMTSLKDSLSWDQRTLETRAGFNTRKDNLTWDQRTLSTRAGFDSRLDNLSWDQRTLKSRAEFNSRMDSLSWDQRTLSSRAEFNSRLDSLSWDQRTLNSKAKFTYSEDGLSWAQTTFSSIANFLHWSNSLSDTPWFWSTAALNDVEDDIPSWKKVLYNFQAYVSGTWGAITSAKGGAYYGGSWHKIPQYAGGTTNAHGSLFIAGEAGPEVVGHIGGRTEVLNQSQLAASISAGVARAINSARFSISGGTPAAAYQQDSEDGMYRAIIQALQALGITGDALNNIEAHISDGEVYNSVRESNRRNTRVTGVNAFA